MRNCVALVRILRIRVLLYPDKGKPSTYPCRTHDEGTRFISYFSNNLYSKTGPKMVWATIYDGAEVVNIEMCFMCNFLWILWVLLETFADGGFIFFQMQGALDVPEQQRSALAAGTSMDHMCALDIDSRASYVRLSGIICTIGNY